MVFYAFYWPIVVHIKGLLSEATNAVSALFVALNPSYWSSVLMRFHLRNIKFILFTSALVSNSQAQCPDYTTYSQVWMYSSLFV